MIPIPFEDGRAETKKKKKKKVQKTTIVMANTNGSVLKKGPPFLSLCFLRWLMKELLYKGQVQ